MLDIILEVVRLLVVAVILFYLFSSGMKSRFAATKGWKFILSGFSLLLFGMVLDVSDNFPELNQFEVIGDTSTEAILEKVVGYLGGFICLAIGFWKWLPDLEKSSIFNASSEAIFIHNTMTGEVLDVNNAMLELYGYSFKDVIDRFLL